MGKRILVQRRGRGSSTFRAPTHLRKGAAKHPLIRLGKVTGIINDLIHDPGRGAPLALIKYDDNTTSLNRLIHEADSSGRHIPELLLPVPASAFAEGRLHQGRSLASHGLF